MVKRNKWQKIGIHWVKLDPIASSCGEPREKTMNLADLASFAVASLVVTQYHRFYSSFDRNIVGIRRVYKSKVVDN